MLVLCTSDCSPRSAAHIRIICRKGDGIGDIIDSVVKIYDSSILDEVILEGGTASGID